MRPNTEYVPVLSYCSFKPEHLRLLKNLPFAHVEASEELMVFLGCLDVPDELKWLDKFAIGWVLITHRSPVDGEPDFTEEWL